MEFSYDEPTHRRGRLAQDAAMPRARRGARDEHDDLIERIMAKPEERLSPEQMAELHELTAEPGEYDVHDGEALTDLLEREELRPREYQEYQGAADSAPC